MALDEWRGDGVGVNSGVSGDNDGSVGFGVVVGGVQRHYAVWVHSNLRRETNRLLSAHSVKT
jgi:hypothetical protein